MFVNTGSTISDNGALYHSGKELPESVVKRIKAGNRLEKLIQRGVLSKERPRLDSEKDKKSGSNNLKNVTIPTKEAKSSEIGKGSEK